MKTKPRTFIRRVFSNSFLMVVVYFHVSMSFAVDYTVNSTGDMGTGTSLSGDLRYCITQANAATGPHRILFTGISGTISLAAPLPVFTQQITVLGNTGLGYVNSPVIEIDATNAGWGFLFNDAGGANSVIEGLAINRAQFSNIGITDVDGITIEDCYIGTNLAGTASAATNPNFGIDVETSSNNQILNNLISGHATHGILVNTNSLNNTIKGNKIGTDYLGTTAIPNAYQGIEVNNSSSGVVIGGTAATDRNIISGNTKTAVKVVGTSPNAQIINNYIGVNLSGTAALGNGEHGIYIDGSSGNTTITNNVIGGNAYFGMLIQNSDIHSIKGNKVGTDATGTIAIGNGTAGTSAGISLVNSNFATIGGTSSGEGNVLSANSDVGLRFDNSTDATVQGNFIGTNATGTGALGNSSSGIYGVNGSNNHVIGGSTSSARNIISCNTVHGINYETNCNNLTIKGNYIGTDATGGGASSTFGNGEIGILINGSSGNCLSTIIGGSIAGEGNVISGNGRLWVSGVNNGTGIQLNGNVTGATIQGNYVGLQSDGTTALGNKENGIVILGCSDVVIGGSSVAERNLVSSNGYQGVVINGSSSAKVYGNYCGVDVTGTLARGNGQSGVILIFSDNCEVGKDAAGYGNLLSNNSELGLHLVGCINTLIYNNYIGVASDGTTAMGNKNGGVFIVGVDNGTGSNGSNNTIGGLGSLQPNIIAYSTGTGANASLGNGFGVGIAENTQGINNTIIGNKIFCNAGLGIDLNFNDQFGTGAGNGGKTAPTITAVTSTSTSGTGIAGETIHVYSNVTCTTCQGETYLGTAIVGAGGTWTVAHASVTTPSNNSATATNSTQGTSQFSCNSNLPVHLVSFRVDQIQEKNVLSWETLWEKNNLEFVIERSQNGKEFEDIARVSGSGTSGNINFYTYEDVYPLNGISFYRLKQVDFDGHSSYSSIVSVNIASQQISVYPNPAENYIIINGIKSDENLIVRLFDNIGQELTLTSVKVGEKVDLEGLSTGFYLLIIETENTIYNHKLYIK